MRLAYLYAALFSLIFIPPLAQHRLNKFDRISGSSGNLGTLTPVCCLFCQVCHELRAIEPHGAVNFIAAEVFEQLEHTVTANQLKKFQIDIIQGFAFVPINPKGFVNHFFIQIVQVNVHHTATSSYTNMPKHSLPVHYVRNPVFKRFFSGAFIIPF